MQGVRNSSLSICLKFSKGLTRHRSKELKSESRLCAKCSLDTELDWERFAKAKESYCVEVSREAEGHRDSPELSPTLAMTAQLLCQSLQPQPSCRNGIHNLNSNLFLVRKECLSTTAKTSASFSADISICILLHKCLSFSLCHVADLGLAGIWSCQ